jgi:hypothetical protein
VAKKQFPDDDDNEQRYQDVEKRPLTETRILASTAPLKEEWETIARALLDA